MATHLSIIVCLFAVCGKTFCSKIYEKSFFEHLLFGDLYNDRKAEKDLLRHLFLGYDKMVGPMKNRNDAVNATLDIIPLSIEALDERNQIIVLETFVKMKWKDDNLQWNPNNFGNMTELRVPISEIYRPDFVLFTVHEKPYLFPVPDASAIIYDNGTVLWVSNFTIKSQCPITKSSQEVVNCNIPIISWIIPQFQLDVEDEKVDLSSFIDTNNNWKLMGIMQSRESKLDPCCEEAHSVFYFNVTIGRRQPHTTNQITTTTNQITTTTNQINTTTNKSSKVDVTLQKVDSTSKKPFEIKERSYDLYSLLITVAHAQTKNRSDERNDEFSWVAHKERKGKFHSVLVDSI